VLKGFETITEASYWVENDLSRTKFSAGKVFKPLYLDELRERIRPPLPYVCI
jgi:hypothetical protein